jgi:putative ubiquitin-RnfH superfamily antitoxin RatB of RatAB toxin-antitoxin module
MACAEAVSGMLRVEVVFSPCARAVQQVQVLLPAGATVRQALQASGLPADGAGAWPPVGIWGRLADLDDPVDDGDRVELYRPLQVDPKEARRLRYRAQGERGRASRGKAAPRKA